MLIDTHAHLFWDSYKEDLDQVIKRALDAGVNIVINVGTDLETSTEALRQAQGIFFDPPVGGEKSQTPFTIYSSIGIHPHDAHKYFSDKRQVISDKLEEDMKKLEQIYKSNPKKVVAVGECGLDYNFAQQKNFVRFSNPDYIPSFLAIDQIKSLQRKLLTAQIDLAKKLNLPLLIHTREAWDEIWPYIEDHFGILHCFSGDLEDAKKALNSNFSVSFAATITYPKNEALREVAKFLPLKKIVLETDCPFLPPQSKRGQRNEPSSVLEIAQLISELKNVPLKGVANQTTQNAKRILNLT